MMSGHLDRHDDVAESALGHGIDDADKQAAKQSALVTASAGDARHESLLLESDSRGGTVHFFVQLVEKLGPLLGA